MRVAFIAHKRIDPYGNQWGGELIEFETRDKTGIDATRERHERQLDEARLAASDSAESASLLRTIGMPVIVTLDDGTEEETHTRSLPWALGHGHYICHLESRPSYDCNRIRPKL